MLMAFTCTIKAVLAIDTYYQHNSYRRLILVTRTAFCTNKYKREIVRVTRALGWQIVIDYLWLT